MEKQNLTITISGHVGSGKSRLAYLLKTFLREEGFEVEFGGNIDFPKENEKEFDKFMSKNLDKTIRGIAESRKITINEVQLNREPKIKKKQ